MASLHVRGGLVERFDQAILDMIRRGGEYRLVCDSSRGDSLQEFKTDLRSSSSQQGFGAAVVYTGDFGFQPVMQITIITYDLGASEALVGWLMGKETEVRTQVMLVRDKAIVEFFRGIYEKYTLGAAVERF